MTVWVAEFMDAGGLIRRARYLVRQSRGKDTQLIGACQASARYYVIHQRFHGLARIKPENNEYSTFASNLGGIAQYFTLAHECGHFFLGHQTTRNTRVEGEQLGAVPEIHQLEYEADLFALRILRKIVGYGTGEPLNPLNIWGSALIAMNAISLNERALLVRCGRTHPPVNKRVMHLSSLIDARVRNSVNVMMAGMQGMLEISYGLHAPLPTACWDLMRRDPRISKFSKTEDYLSAHQQMDELLTWETMRIERGLANTRLGQVILDGVRRGRSAGSAGQALAAWGVDRYEIDLYTERNSSLSFHAAMEAIRASPAAQADPQKSWSNVFLLLMELSCSIGPDYGVVKGNTLD